MTTPDSDRATAAQGFYSRWARAYDTLARRAPGVRGLRRDTAAALDLAPGDTVVDVGCGTGANLPALRERVGPSGTVVGVDFAPGAVARARAHVAREGWTNVHVCRGDATRLPSPTPTSTPSSPPSSWGCSPIRRRRSAAGWTT
ncbi:class I SAM-dependent methyltransferase [Haloplanus litoreus]|uniref:class I SAM-dependent methyltransferase n=1 Tax=Haloplanus litoreus TaxID=767515 RepID=UPI0036115C27